MAAVSDPRRVLREAADRRTPCELLNTGAQRQLGLATQGTVVRVEPSGVVITAPGRRLSGGEDLRLWFVHNGQRYRFEASVLRTGVPVPDRSQDGVLLGFIDRWQEGQEAGLRVDDCVIELLPPNGPAVSLLQPPVRVVDVSLTELTFTVPASFTLVFMTQSRVRLRLGAPGHATVEVNARVASLVPSRGSLMYTLAFEGATDADALREISAVLDSLL